MNSPYQTRATPDDNIPHCPMPVEVADATIEPHPSARAIETAIGYCNDCPIRQTCLQVFTREENKDVGGVIGGLTREQRFPKEAPVIRVQCGTEAGAGMHYRNGEKRCMACREALNARRRGDFIPKDRSRRFKEQHDRRLADLQHLIEADSGLDEALRQLNMTRDSLRKWCQRHGHIAIYQKLGKFEVAA